MAIDKTCIGPAKGGIEVACSLEECSCPVLTVALEHIRQPVPLKEQIVGAYILRRTSACHHLGRLLDALGNGGDHAARNLVLDREHILERTVEAVRPKVGSRDGVDQLRGDPDPV